MNGLYGPGLLSTKDAKELFEKCYVVDRPLQSELPSCNEGLINTDLVFGKHAMSLIIQDFDEWLRMHACCEISKITLRNNVVNYHCTNCNEIFVDGE